MTPSFKTRLVKGEILIGPLVTLPAPDVTDLLSRVGFDYLWIDLEHSAMDISQAQAHIQAAGDRCPCLIRVPENSEAWIKKALDTGCDGVIIPQIRSAAEARAAVAWCKYPPAGRRGAGPTRAHGWGLSFGDYVATANETLTIILQIEHIDAVNDIEAILAVPGITALFVGPYDLSGSLGLLGQVSHPRVQEAIDRVIVACRSAQMPLGLYVGDAAGARAGIARGFTMIALGSDAGLLLGAAQTSLAAAREIES